MATSLAKYEATTSGFREAVGKFSEKRKCQGPEEPILAPSSKHSLFTNSLFRWLLRALCRFKTLTGLTKPPKLLAPQPGLLHLSA